MLAGRRAAAALCAIVATVALAGCGGGGTAGAGTLSMQADELRSLAAEGGLLAEDAASGRTTGVFVREHASELESAASATASSLETAAAVPGLEPERRRIIALATRIRTDLGRIDGADDAGRRALSRRLLSAARASGDVAGRLG